VSAGSDDTTPWSDATTPLAVVAERLACFNADRDWGQFHNPKDLAICLNGEAAEVLELFLWKPTADHVPEGDREALRQELADVLISTLNLAQRAGIDLTAAAQEKIALNAAKYPVELSRGSALKYHRLQESGED